MDIMFLFELQNEEISVEDDWMSEARLGKEWAKTSPHKEGCTGADWNKGNRFNGT